jgi:hypothetical protein
LHPRFGDYGVNNRWTPVGQPLNRIGTAFGFELWHGMLIKPIVRSKEDSGLIVDDI